jgi:hypothetical protein
MITTPFPFLRDEGDRLVRAHDDGEGAYGIVVVGATATMMFLALHQHQREPETFYLFWAVAAALVGFLAAYSTAQSLWNRSEVHFTAEKLRLREGPFPFWREREVRRAPGSRLRIVPDRRRLTPHRRPRFRLAVSDPRGRTRWLLRAALPEEEARYFARRVTRVWKVPVDRPKGKRRKKRRR